MSATKLLKGGRINVSYLLYDTCRPTHFLFEYTLAFKVIQLSFLNYKNCSFSQKIWGSCSLYPAGIAAHALTSLFRNIYWIIIQYDACHNDFICSHENYFTDDFLYKVQFSN